MQRSSCRRNYLLGPLDERRTRYAVNQGLSEEGRNMQLQVALAELVVFDDEVEDESSAASQAQEQEIAGLLSVPRPNPTTNSPIREEVIEGCGLFGPIIAMVVPLLGLVAPNGGSCMLADKWDILLFYFFTYTQRKPLEEKVEWKKTKGKIFEMEKNEGKTFHHDHRFRVLRIFQRASYHKLSAPRTVIRFRRRLS